MSELFHDRRARRYDETIRRVIPGYQALHQMSASLLQDALTEDARLLVVGAGTGSELETLAAAGPGWSFTACDPSAAMLEVARQRMESAGHQGRVQFHPCRLDEIPPADLFQAATCLLVLHFIPDDGRRLALLQDMARRLAPGSPLIFADMLEPVDSPRFRTMLPAWRQAQANAGIPPEEIEKGRLQVENDIYFISEERMTSLLQQAGFSAPQRFFAAFLFGGFICQRL